MWVILLHRSKDPHGPGADQLPKSLLSGLQGLALAREGSTCFSVPCLWACTHSPTDLCGWAGSSEHSCCPVTPSSHVPNGFPILSCGSHGFSAASPGDPARSELLAFCRRDRGFRACLQAGWDRKFELFFGPTVQQRQALHYRRAVALEIWSLS